jgi:hypothetical protein
MREVVLTAALASLAVCVLPACQKHERKLHPPAGQLVVHDEMSDLTFTMKPEGNGYGLTAGDGTSLGTVKIGERVVVHDASGRAVARVAHKPGGYELTDGDGIAALMGRIAENDQHVRLLTPTGAEFAVASGTQLKVSGEVVQATRQGDHVAVGRGGRRVVKVEGVVEPRAAAYLGATELDVYRRIALLVWTDRWK